MISEESIRVVHSPWLPPPAWSRLRRKTLAVVYHWAAMTNPAKTSQQNMYDYIFRNLKTKAYHAIIKDEIWRCMHWDMTAGALGLNGLDDYPVETKQRFGNVWPDIVTINILMMEDDKEGRYSIKTMNNGVMLGAFLCKRYGLHPTEHVLRHTDVTEKGIRPPGHPLYKEGELPCPRFFVENKSAWEMFRLRIREILVMENDGRWNAADD